MSYKSSIRRAALRLEKKGGVQYPDITISIDAMGGEYAPYAVVHAISIICTKYHGVRFLIFGDNEDRVLGLIRKFKLPENRYEIFTTCEVILDEDSPINALRSSKDSSMRRAVEAVKANLAHACVSCGNTGALMVIAKTVLGGLSHIKRPAIIGFFPTLKGKAIMLDMGANTDCNEVLLFQFALMGNCFARAVLGKKQPSIGLLNVGVEQIKGREIEKKTFDMLVESGLNFVGYIEGHDITQGKVDVVVTDGFSGNLVLKASEGAANMCLELIRAACTKDLRSKIGALLLKRSFKEGFKIMDPTVNNGAMFIGVNGIVVKSHGRSDALGISRAIEVAINLAKDKINEKISHELQVLEEQGVGLNLVDKVKYTSAKILGFGNKHG